MDVRVPLAAAATMILAACSGGKPASVAEVTDKLKDSFGKDGYEVTWLIVNEKEEPGSFNAIIDRIEDGDPTTEETQICDVSASANASSWTCQAAKPSIMIQAGEMLKKQYESRNIVVHEYNLRRTGEANAFAGYFVLSQSGSSETVRLPCKGDQDGTDFEIDCDAAFGTQGDGDTPAAGTT